MPSRATRARTPRQLVPGTKLRVRIGEIDVDATVLEDRGPIAPGGLHLLRLIAQLDPGGEPSTFDLSIDLGSG